jgi:hypothetical protein
VEADRDAEPAEEVHAHEQCEVVDADDLVPGHDDRGDDDERRRHDGDEVRDLRRAGQA